MPRPPPPAAPKLSDTEMMLRIREKLCWCWSGAIARGDTKEAKDLDDLLSFAGDITRELEKQGR
jgi:hypothetical protein